MTIAATITSEQFPCNGATSQFSFPNKVFAASDLTLTLIDTLGNLYTFVNFLNAATGLSYLVQNVDVDTGCLIVMSGAPADGWTLDVRSAIPETQSTSIKNQGAFLPELHEEAFDRLTRLLQDLLRLTYTFGIHGPDIESTPWPALPAPASRLGLVLMFDPVTGLPTLGQPTTTNVTAGSIATLLNAYTTSAVLPPLVRSAAEIAAGVTPVNYAYVPGIVDRYGTNTTPGTTDMTAAINAANSVAAQGGPTITFLNEVYAVASSLTISYPCAFGYGAQIKPAASQTVTINASIAAFNTQIFNLSNAGALIRGSLGGVNLIPQWWGAVADGNFNTGAGTDNTSAFQATESTAAARSNQFNQAPNGIFIPAGIYKQSSQVTVSDGIHVQGAGPYVTVIYAPTAFANTGGLWAVNGGSGVPSSMRDLGVIGQVGGCSGAGIVVTKNGVLLDSLWVAAFSSSYGVQLSNTDTFLTNSVLELNFYGVGITQSDVTVANCKTYQNVVAGIIVNNGSSSDNGRVTINGVRCYADGQIGLLVSSGRHVSLIGCDCSSNLNAKLSHAGIQIDASTDVVVSGCSGQIATGASTAPGILVSSTSTQVAISGGSWQGFYDGLQANNALNLTVNGGLYMGNSRYGIYLGSGGPCTVTGVQCTSNASDGIHADNSGGSGFHLLVGNTSTINGAYGFTVNIGIGTAFSNVQGNLARGNTSGQYNYTGTTANINEGTTPTNY